MSNETRPNTGNPAATMINPEFTHAMRQLVVDLDAIEDRSLPIDSLGTDKSRLVAAFLLIQSGEVGIDLDDPENLILTEKGRWLRQGVLVVSGE